VAKSTVGLNGFLTFQFSAAGYRTRVTAGSGIAALTVELTSLVVLRSASPLSSVSTSSAVSPFRLAQVGVMSPGDTAAAQRSSELDCGVGGSMATRFGTIVTAPLIPRQSKGRGPAPPPTTGQSQNPLFGPSRQYKTNSDKEGKTVDKIKETAKCSRVVGWGGSTNFSSTDAKGIPSNLVINPPLYPTSTGGTCLGCSSTSHFNGCVSVLCCSPSRDMSLVAGSRDKSPVTATSPPSTSLSSSCRCCSSSVCLCRDYEKTQGCKPCK
jgi:hypothetical protein